MNPVTFNDYFKDAVTGVEDPAGYQKLSVSPLFDYPFDADSGRVESVRQEMMVKEDEDERAKLFPFKKFRIVLKPTIPNPESIPKGWYDVKRLTFHMMVVADNCYYFRCPDSPVDRERVHHLEWGYGDKKNLHWYNPKTDRWTVVDDPKEVDVYYYSAVRSLLMFSYDVMTPTNHIAEVKPVSEHKSVEWVMARTHYTLITHGHPANRKEIKEGAQVDGDATGELTRMAHCRRQHKRTLRSACFRFAKGRTIDVRAAWIGPKEWMDQGGKQIYRILNEGDLK